MGRFELTVSPDYVPDWTEVEAVRELFQNALDSPGEMSWTYNDGLKEFRIMSEDVGLTKETLLFGATSKANDSSAIGNFGEGYKLAFLVLARLGYKVKVYNYALRERWFPKIIKSRRYNSKLLVVDVERRHLSERDLPLTFVIPGLSKKSFDKIAKKNLHIDPTDDVIETDYGRILRDPKYQGMLFIKGLYVCSNSKLRYGYDILPMYLETNRDRNLASDFNIFWATSRMWGSSGLPMLVSQLIKAENSDVKYIDSFKKKDLTETMYAEFVSMYGKYAVPVETQEEYDIIKNTYRKLKPIFVKPLERDIIYRYVSDNTISKAKLKDVRSELEQKRPVEVMEEFYKKHKYRLVDKVKCEFKQIIELSKQWRIK